MNFLYNLQTSMTERRYMTLDLETVIHLSSVVSHACADVRVTDTGRGGEGLVGCGNKSSTDNVCIVSGGIQCPRNLTYEEIAQNSPYIQALRSVGD